MPASEQMWAIVQHHPHGFDWIYHVTIRRTRAETIQRFVDIFADESYGRKIWRKERDAGNVECVRVTVTATVNEPTPTEDE